MIDAALASLEAFGKASGLARSANIYAVTSAAHIMGLGLLFGSIAAIDLRLIGWARGLGAEALATLRRFAMAGLVLAVITGVLLASTKPFEYAANPFMLWKLAVLAAAIMNALAFELWSSRRGVAQALADRAGRWFGAASLTLWLAVIVLGRMIAFV
jgi:uncharacterized protein YacL